MINKIIKEDIDLFKLEIAYNIGFGAALISICYSAKNRTNNEFTIKQLDRLIKRLLMYVECLENVNNKLKEINIPKEKK